MRFNPKYLIYHDLIGLKAFAKDVKKPNSSRFLDIGEIIDESKNMIITEKEKKIKKYIKKDYIFRFELPKKKAHEEEYLLEVIGTKIVGHPLNRLRNLKKKKRMVEKLK